MVLSFFVLLQERTPCAHALEFETLRHGFAARNNTLFLEVRISLPQILRRSDGDLLKAGSPMKFAHSGK